MRVSGDTVFQADVRSLRKRTAAVSSTVPLRLRHEPLEIVRQAADRGAIAVCDAAQMPDGRMLVAAGEVGAWLLSPEGKMLARFAEPTSRIVASDHGDRAILTATRGEVCRLSRLDLLERRVRPWCDARIDRFAPDFDGLTWFVARGGTLYAVDATAARFEHLWKVDEAGAVVREVRRSATSMSAWFEWRPSETPQRQMRPPEVWTYELPSLTLRRRQPVEARDKFTCGHSDRAEGDAAGWTIGADTEMGRPQSTKAWCRRKRQPQGRAGGASHRGCARVVRSALPDRGMGARSGAGARARAAPSARYGGIASAGPYFTRRRDADHRRPLPRRPTDRIR